jgi:hypothetical protein
LRFLPPTSYTTIDISQDPGDVVKEDAMDSCEPALFNPGLEMLYPDSAGMIKSVLDRLTISFYLFLISLVAPQ